jgi:tripartite-type tricarboxylate transporter receptor subunit TctC
MRLARRQLLRWAASVAALPIVPRVASAQAYPTKPVRMIVGFASGSASDILTRLIAQWLSERLGQPFVIENRGGAGGTLGAEAAVRAPPDGYTLLACGSADAVNASLYDKLNYNFIREITPIADIAYGPLVLVIHPSFPAQTIPEFIAYAKANPDKVAFGSAGIGTVAHMAGALFMALTGVQLVYVPYRGLAPALTDLIGGQVQAIFSTMPPAIAHVKAGKLRALGVTSAGRSEAFPELPPIANFVPGYEASLRQGIGGPKDIPASIVDKLNKEINAGLADPGIKARLADLGMMPAPVTPAVFGQLLADETDKWGKVIRAANIKSQ